MIKVRPYNKPLKPIKLPLECSEMTAPNQPPMPGYGPAVVSTQPVPGTGVGYRGPPGLEYLAMIDHLLIKQQVELLEAFTGWESCNKYKIMNNLGQDVFFAKEDTDCCTRMVCGPGRPFEMNIVDNSGKEVIHLVRPLRCTGCCFPCCLQEMEVHSPLGTIIGSVEQKWTLCTPLFAIKNERGEEIMTIEGPVCGCECCSDIDFNITSAGDGSEVCRNVLCDKHNYNIN